MLYLIKGKRKEVLRSLNNNVDDLVNLARKGDHQAYSEIVMLMQQEIFKYCYPMMGNRQDAEDMVQETFIRAYENLSKYHEEGRFKGWLFTIANRTCLNKLRRKSRFHALINKLETETSTSNIVEASNIEIMSLLDALNPKAKAIIILRVLHDMSYEEISNILGISASSLRKQYERARKKLQKEISIEDDKFKRGVEYEW